MKNTSAPSMRLTLLCSFTALFLSSLSGCGGGSTSIVYLTPQGSSQSSSDDNATAVAEAFGTADYVFPYKSGDHVVMIDIDPRNPDSVLYPSVMKVTGTAIVGGQSGFVVSEADQSPTYRYQDFVSVDAGGVYKSPMPSDASVRPPLSESYPLVLHVGDQFTLRSQVSSEIDAVSGNLIPVTLSDVETVEGLEDVTTRMGHYQQCLKLKSERIRISTVGGKPTTSPDPSNATWNWFCKGIGLVRWQQIDGSYSGEMMAYEIGGQRNETVAPEATVSGVPTAEQHWKLDTLKVTFNELMSLSTLNAASIIITDSQHRVIEGDYATGPNWVTFKPHMGAMTEDGDYQLQVTAGAKDWAGNGATPASWTFHVDGHPPIPTSTIPANQSTGVPTNQVIQINFGEPIRIGFMPDYAAVIDLTQGPEAMQIVSAQLDSGKILIQPAMQPGHTYRVHFYGQVFYDLADNIWQDPLDFTFTTAQ